MSAATQTTQMAKNGSGISLVVQWLRLYKLPMNPGLIPGQGPRSHMPRLRVRVLPLRPGSDKLIKISIKKMRQNDSEPGYLLQGGMIF